MNTVFHDSRKIPTIIVALKIIDEVEHLLIPVSVMKEADHLWRQVFTLFLEKAKRLQEKSNTKEQHQRMAHGNLAKPSRKPFIKRNDSSKSNIRCYYCYKNGHIAKECLKE